ncbi:restriction endonuclease subunit S [Megamonas funiformis]|jgi:type I restriction enzyme S subunit|uniref:restriction endonuclease subunit S n=1 Tax=Megamonas funiformis TaxID=437897 RepID=UPI003AF5ED1A
MNVPKLRFKEFTDEWKQTPLKNIIYSNIIEAPKPTTDYIRLGIRSHCKGTFHELVKIENILSADKMYIVPKNNLILNITFAWEQAIAITDDNDEGKYISNRFPTFAFKDNQLPTFYKYIIPQKRLKYDLNVASPGGAGRNRVLNKKLFLSIPVNIPLLKEQEKIAKFLTTVDKKITNLENTITSLENQKKGLLQQIFSQKLRFKDKNGNNYPNWEKKKLGDIGSFSRGGNLSKSDLSKKGTSCILYGELYTYYNEFATEIKSKTLNTTNLVLSKKYDVLLPLSGETAEDISTCTCIFFDDIALGSDLLIFRSSFFDGRFMSLLLKYKYKYKIAQIAQGKSIVHISEKNIKNINIKIPCIEEQQNIADFILIFTKKLENQKAQLEHWKQIKKGLLQQMFV